MPVKLHSLRRATEGVRDLFFPPRCLGCDTLLPPLPDGETVLCPLCRTAWESARVEAAPMAAEAMRHGHTFAVLYHAGHTEGVPERVIYHIKHIGSPRAFALVAAALAPRIHSLLAQPTDGPVEQAVHRADDPPAPPSADAVAVSLPTPFVATQEDTCPPLFTYPPRRRKAVREDGFDQAARLAKALAATCEGEFVPLLRRTHRPTSEQKHLSAEARFANATASYALGKTVSSRVRGRTVILCDDLATTGATLHACAALLREAGAARVLWVTVGQTTGRGAEVTDADEPMP